LSPLLCGDLDATDLQSALLSNVKVSLEMEDATEWSEEGGNNLGLVVIILDGLVWDGQTGLTCAVVVSTSSIGC
jgi:hypothetical protein